MRFFLYFSLFIFSFMGPLAQGKNQTTKTLKIALVTPDDLQPIFAQTENIFVFCPGFSEINSSSKHTVAFDVPEDRLTNGAECAVLGYTFVNDVNSNCEIFTRTFYFNENTFVVAPNTQSLYFHCTPNALTQSIVSVIQDAQQELDHTVLIRAAKALRDSYNSR